MPRVAGIVREVDEIRLRVVAGGTLALLVAAGLWLSGKTQRDSDARVEALRAGRASQEERSADVAEDEAFAARIYEAAVAEDAERFGLEGVDVLQLREPNAHAIELQDAEVLRSGHSWASPHLVVRAKQEKVTYQQHGATVAATHVIAEVENVGEVPVAYNLRVRSRDRGRCDVRGVRTHNGLALDVGEKVSIVVCAGRGSIRLEHVEILELTPLGYHYISGLPAEALGIDPVTAQAHEPTARVPACGAVDARKLSAKLSAGEARWVDVADFYSRHSCERWQFVTGYRHAEAPLERLPIAR